MTRGTRAPKQALKYEARVAEHGRLELDVPFPAGRRVTVFVVEEPGDPFTDLESASASSQSFWDNPFDDEDWNDA